MIYEENSYKLLGNNINTLLENKILEIPDYVKIDVDGIEHLILEGADRLLESTKIKEISVEINEDFVEQKQRVENVLSKYNFDLRVKVEGDGYSKLRNKSIFNYTYKKKKSWTLNDQKVH